MGVLATKPYETGSGNHIPREEHIQKVKTRGEGGVVCVCEGGFESKDVGCGEREKALPPLSAALFFFPSYHSSLQSLPSQSNRSDKVVRFAESYLDQAERDSCEGVGGREKGGKREERAIGGREPKKKHSLFQSYSFTCRREWWLRRWQSR